MINLRKLNSVLLVCLIFSISKSVAQTSWVEMMNNPAVNFYDVQSAFNSYYNKYVLIHGKEPKEVNGIFKKKEKESEFEVPGFEQYKRWEYFTEQRVFPSGNRQLLTNPFYEYTTKVKPFINQSRSTTWTLIGPTNQVPNTGGAGRINFIRFMPGNNNIIFAGAPVGGLWKSTDGGVTWSTNTDDLAVIGCSDLAIDPSNTNIMYLATGDRDAGDSYSVGVLKTTDGGASWNATGLSFAVSANETVNRILINPTTPSTLIAFTSNGIYRSTDAAVNWTHVVASGNYKDAEFNPGDPNTVYCCSNLFYKSTNGGTTFTNVSSGLSGSGVRMAIAVSAANAATVYVVAANNIDYGLLGFYKSTNSGTSFTLQNSTYDILGFNTNGTGGGGQGWYDLAIDVSPTDANAVVVGGINTFKSANGGTTWSIHGAGYGANAKIHPDVHEVSFAPGTSNCFVGCDGGIFKTTNNGSTFSDLSDQLQIAQAYRLSNAATNANITMSGWQDNGTNRSNAGAWDNVLGGDGMETIISWSSSQTMYGELYYGEIYKSTNGGNSFSNNSIVGTGGTAGTVDEDGEWVTPYVQDPNTAATLYVGKTKIYKSTNSGTSWSALSALTGGSGKVKAIACAKSNSQYLYCAKQDRFWVTTNGGTSFT
ncbi:MAG: glycosyl hydrolase, partial [Bacteroidota bacterium]